MARANLDQLVQHLESPDTAPKPSEVAEVTQLRPEAAASSSQDQSVDKPKRGSGTTKNAPAPQRAATKRSESVTNDGTPLYLTFERKAVRLRADQYEKLSVNARRLNKAKGPGGVRITENTLARVAFDLLLSRLDELHGATEEDLRRSLGLPG